MSNAPDPPTFLQRLWTALRWFASACIGVCAYVLGPLFRRSPRGPLFRPTLITNLILFLTAVIFGFKFYVSQVESAYRSLFVAYHRANAFRDALSEDATVPLSVDKSDIAGFDPDLVVLFRMLQLSGLKSVDETPDILRNSDDDYHAVYSALVDPGREELSLLDDPTSLVIAQLTLHASGRESDTESGVERQLARSQESIAAILANQPTAFGTLQPLSERSGEEEPTPEQMDDVLDELGKGLSIPADITLITTRAAALEWSDNSAAPRGIRIHDELQLSLFADAPPSDVDALRVLFGQMGVLEREDVGVNGVEKTPANDPETRQFTRLRDFALSLVARLHANPDVKAARARIAFVQGPEQLGLLIGFFWMSLLLLSRSVKRLLVWLQYTTLQRRIAATLAEGGVDDAEASLKRRKKIVVDLSERLGDEGDVTFLDPWNEWFDALRGGTSRGPEWIPVWISRLYGWLGTFALGLLLFFVDPWPRSESLEGGLAWLDERRRTMDAHSASSDTKKPVMWYLAWVGTGLLVALHWVYRAYSWLWRRGSLAVFHAGRSATLRLFQITKNELGSSDPSPDVLRNACRVLRERERSSRWIIRWIARALPAIGFIGTVRGISMALSNADSIVRAQTTAGQAAAITSNPQRNRTSSVTLRTRWFHYSSPPCLPGRDSGGSIPWPSAPRPMSTKTAALPPKTRWR